MWCLAWGVMATAAPVVQVDAGVVDPGSGASAGQMIGLGAGFSSASHRWSLLLSGAAEPEGLAGRPRTPEDYSPSFWMPTTSAAVSLDAAWTPWRGVIYLMGPRPRVLSAGFTASAGAHSVQWLHLFTAGYTDADWRPGAAVGMVGALELAPRWSIVANGSLWGFPVADPAIATYDDVGRFVHPELRVAVRWAPGRHADVAPHGGSSSTPVSAGL